MNEVTLKCSDCECELAWQVQGKDNIIYSPSYCNGFSKCVDCLIQHCLTTNCYICKLGKYHDCSFLETKSKVFYKEDEE